METEPKVIYLMKQTFNDYNCFKRALTLEEIEHEKGNDAKTIELTKYKTLAKLELSLRALQSEIRREITE
ncbi:hypothetical protein [Bacillus paralicheniformis]|uniref:hypothetical protein n=1 Tax=Bacillus paralicheniformis TaxID=1648923 RepID=UPI00189CCD6A|nr:hypothetical protein [Bacillus paralicheniformis]